MKIWNWLKGLILESARSLRVTFWRYRLSHLKTEVHNHPDTMTGVLCTGAGGYMRDVSASSIHFKVGSDNEPKS